MKNKKQLIRDTAKSFLLVISMMALVLFSRVTAIAAIGPQGPFGGVLNQVASQAQLPDFGTAGHGQSSVESGASNITSAIYFVIDLAKYLVGTIAIIMIIVSGVRLVTAGAKIDEIAPKMKHNILYAIIGLLVIMVADPLVKQVFFGEQGEVFRSEADVKLAAERGTDLIKGIYNFFEVFIGSISVLMIVIAGFRMVTSGGKEETIGKAKKQITYAIVGIVIIGMAEFVIKGIVFPAQGTRISNLMMAQMLIVNLTNFASSFIATIAIAYLMYGGYLYVTGFGKEENPAKAKKVFTTAIIGILIAMAAYGIINTVIQLQPLQDTGTQQQTQDAAVTQ